jgi:prepilin-type N-terminal cleavage/methylation domain-containing protein
MKRDDGFTLVEMAVVMVLIGIMLTMGISGWLITINSSAMRATKDKQLVIRDALISYLRSNGRLPCPDVGPTAVIGAPIAAGVVLDGRENRAALAGLDPDTAADCANVFGAIPYVDLGLNRDAALDAWGNYMIYRVSNDPVTFSDWVRKANVNPANRGSMWVSDRVSALATIPPVVVTLISHGKNALAAWTTRQSQIDPTGSGADETDNAAGCVAVTGGFTCYSRDITESTVVAGGPFDDIVLGITVSDLTSPLIKDGSMKSPTAALNETFESIIDLVATIAVKTNYPAPPAVTPSCSYTLTGSKTLSDPWGQAITCGATPVVYTIGAAGTLCTMTSNGPDKALATSDDIVRAVNNRELDTRLLRLGC